MANGTCLVIIYYKNLYFNYLSCHRPKPMWPWQQTNFGRRVHDLWQLNNSKKMVQYHRLAQIIWIIFQNLPNVCRVRDTDSYFSLIFIIQDHFQTYIYHNPSIWCIPIYLNYYSLILIFIIIKYKIICSHWFQWLYLFYNVTASLTHTKLKYYFLWF